MKSEEPYENEESCQPDIFIWQFNEFILLLDEYLGIKISPNEKGYSFALAQYFLRYVREDRLDELYYFIYYISSQLNKEHAETLLKSATLFNVSKQEVANNSTENQASRYNNFRLPLSDFYFNDLMYFIKWVSNAQESYQRLLTRGPFRDELEHEKPGRLENIIGNWEGSYPVSCSRAMCNVSFYIALA